MLAPRFDWPAGPAPRALQLLGAICRMIYATANPDELAALSGQGGRWLNEIEQARWFSAFLHGAGPPEPICTGLTARWCAVHGTCTCPFDTGWEHMDSPACPLHSPLSDHPLGQ